ncbi:MAG: hypothetical protein ACN4GT_11245 [Gammaproteobacteria bacterium]
MHTGKWHDLTREEAQSCKLFGFGGSLFVVYGLAAFLLVWQMYGALNSSPGLAMMYGSEGNASVMRVVLIIKALSWIPFLILAPMRHRLMPSVTLACIVATFLLDLIAVNIVIALPMPKSIGVNVFNLIIAGAFSLYFLRSKRVNLTYRLRECAPHASQA